MAETTKYNKRVWLNSEDSASTGNMVVFDGEVTYRKDKSRETFLSISDCNVSARLHKTSDDSDLDFIKKIKLIKNTLEGFILHLESCT